MVIKSLVKRRKRIQVKAKLSQQQGGQQTHQSLLQPDEARQQRRSPTEDTDSDLTSLIFLLQAMGADRVVASSLIHREVSNGPFIFLNQLPYFSFLLYLITHAFFCEFLKPSVSLAHSILACSYADVTIFC